RAHHGKRNGRDQREHDQRLYPAGGQHAVVDLQHVDRQGQHEHVDDEAENRAHGESRATSPNGSLEVRRIARAPLKIGALFWRGLEGLLGEYLTGGALDWGGGGGTRREGPRLLGDYFVLVPRVSGSARLYLPSTRRNARRLLRT